MSPASPDILVEKYTNSSYDVIKTVSDNLDSLLTIANLNNFNIVAITTNKYVADMRLAVHWIITLGGHTDISFINVPITGKTARVSFRLIQDATGTRIPTFPVGWKWNGGVTPTWGTIQGDEDYIEGFTEDGGVTWRANLVGQNYV